MSGSKRDEYEKYHLESESELTLTAWLNCKLEQVFEKEKWLASFAPHLKLMGHKVNILMIRDSELKDKIVGITMKDDKLICDTCHNNKELCIHKKYAIGCLEISNLRNS